MTRRRWYSLEARALCLATGLADPSAAITQLAMTLIDDADFEGPPVSLPVLASFQGITEIRPTAMVGAARLVPEGAALVIEVNQEHSSGRQNFSSAHEVTHTLIPTYRRQRIEDNETGTFASHPEEELLCDIGASALLLDARWLRPMALAAGPSIQTLLNLATLFGASLQATAWKLAKLDLWSCAFVFWEPGFRKEERVPTDQMLLSDLGVFGRPEPKLRVKSPYVAPSFGQFIPSNKSVEGTSLVASCWATQEPSAGVEVFPWGHGGIRLYCENIYAPYRVSGEARDRVISFLLRTGEPPARPPMASLRLFDDL